MYTHANGLTTHQILWSNGNTAHTDAYLYIHVNIYMYIHTFTYISYVYIYIYIRTYMPRPCAYTHTEPLKRQALEAEKERRNIGRFPPEIFLAVYIISYDEHGVMQRAL